MEKITTEIILIITNKKWNVDNLSFYHSVKLSKLRLDSLIISCFGTTWGKKETTSLMFVHFSRTFRKENQTLHQFHFPNRQITNININKEKNEWEFNSHILS